MPPSGPEKSIQRDVVRVFQQCGAVVYDFSQPRATKQTPGIPDLFVCFPDRGKAFWFEVKSATGDQSKDQISFQNVSERSGVPYVVGGMTEALEQLKAIGFKLELGVR